MNGKHTAEPPPDEAIGAQVRQLRSGASRLLHDLVTLGELQTRLFVVDAKQGVRKTAQPIILLLIAVGLALGTIPIALAGIAGLLVLAGLHWAAALWIAIAVGAASAGLLVWLARKRMRSSPQMFERSLAELNSNITWLKQNVRPPTDD